MQKKSQTEVIVLTLKMEKRDQKPRNVKGLEKLKKSMKMDSPLQFLEVNTDLAAPVRTVSDL